MGADFRRPTPADIIELAAGMRPADVAELEATGQVPLEALQASVAVASSAVAIVHQGRLLAIGGYRLEPASYLGQRVACAWVLTSHAVDEQPVAFHRAAREWLLAAFEHVDLLWNLVDARYVSSLRWLTRLGFIVHPAEPVGPKSMPFHLVTRSL